MSKISKCMFTLVLVLFYGILFGQQENCHSSLFGQIIDEHDQSPLEYASIYIKELKRGVTADAEGNYTISGLCPAEYTIEVRHIGCNPRVVLVDVKGNSKRHFHLEHHLEELQEIIFVGEGAQHDKEAFSKTLTSSEIEEARGKSLGESLKNLSGVNSLQTGPTISKPVIQGLHSNRILILNNGIRQEGQQWGQEHAPEIDPFAASDFSVVKGASAVKYGADAIGGVVLVEPAPLLRDKGFKGEAGIVGNSSNRQGTLHAQVEGGKEGGFGWRIQSSAKKGGDAKAANYRLSNTGIEEKNISTAFGINREKFGLELYYSHFDADIAILRSAHVGNQQDLLNAINNDVPSYVEEFSYKIDNPRQEVRHDLLKLSGRWKVDCLGELKLKYGFQSNNRKEYDRRRGQNFNRPSILLGINTHTIDLELKHRPIGSFIGDIGISSTFQRNKNKEGTNASFLIPDYKNFGIGLYAIERYVKEDWELEMGLRFDHKKLSPLVFNASRELLEPNYSFNNMVASISAERRLGDKLKLMGNLSTAWRPPHVSELFSNGLHHGAASIEYGLLVGKGILSPSLNSDVIPTEKALKVESGLEYSSGKLSWEASVFYNQVGDFIFLRPESMKLTIRGYFPEMQYNTTDARFVGLDAKVNYEHTENWSYSGKLSILRADDLNSSGDLINIPANSFRNAVTYENSSLVGIKNLYFTVETFTVSRQNNAPIVFIDFESNEPPAQTFDYKEAPDGYTLVNFHSGIEFDKFKLGFSVENLLNKSYRDYMNRFRYFADDLGINYTIRIFYNF
ncbi:MAG: TonB-dependent receptor [Cyclobacteriaceae bacterium]